MPGKIDDTSNMATANGTLTPPPRDVTTSTSATKRKRSESNSLAQTNGLSALRKDAATETDEKGRRKLVQDVIEILKGYDTKPSILEHPISKTKTRSSTTEPSSKRTKVSDSQTTTILQQAQNGSYASLDELVEDLDTASADLLASKKTTDSMSNGLRAPPSFEETRLMTGVLAIKKVLRTMSVREAERKHATTEKPEAEEMESDDVKPVVNGTTNGTPSAPIVDEMPERRTVLTLFGSAQRPQQLFSSLQQPVAVGDHSNDHLLDTSVKVFVPLDEGSLPNIISTTKIIPGQTEALGKPTTSQTFREVFAPPPNLRPLNPPKPAKRSTAKTIGWVSESLSAPSRKSSTYSNQSLSTGMWLGYGGIDVPKEPTSPTAKQRHRQRALSTGEAHPPLSEAETTALELAKEEALFRSVYSSFAPCRDDSVAIVPEALKNQVWWQKVGEKRFTESMTFIDPALLDDEAATAADDLQTSVNGEVEPVEDEEELFKKAIEDYNPDGEQFEVKPKIEEKEEKDVDEMLREISELLETLSSFQRIRNSTLGPTARTPIAQATSASSLIGSPSSPSSAEVDLYKMIKSQLALLISGLPPYAVAKLNGDQLDELNISRTIAIERKDYRGVMEEDQVSRLAKHVAYSAPAATPAPRMNPAVGAQSHYTPSASQYGRTTPASHIPPRASYYPQQQPPNRPSSVHYQRSSGSAYQTPAAYPTTPRQSFPATQAYGQQTPRQSYQPNASYYQQRSAQQGFMGSQYFSSNQHSQAQMRYQQASSAYQQHQRPQNATPLYNYQSSQVRNGSPHKPPPSAQTQYSQARPMYGTPNNSAGQRPTSYFQQLSQAAANHSQYAAGTAAPSAAYPSGLTPEQQQMLMNQHRNALQAHSRAQSIPSRQGSGTPQPPPGTPQQQQPQNGQYPGQANGTPMVA